MQVNFDTNRNNYQQSFKSVEIGSKVCSKLKSRYYPPSKKDMDLLEGIIKFFQDTKGIHGKLELDKEENLVASVKATGHSEETITESALSYLFRSPIHFLKKWEKIGVRYAERVEVNDRLDRLAKKYKQD